MDKTTKSKRLSAMTDQTEGSADRWLDKRTNGGGILGRMRFKAARELGERTGPSPLVMPPAMLALVAASPELLQQQAVAAVLCTLMVGTTAARVLYGNRLAHASETDWSRWTHRYTATVCLSGLAWALSVSSVIVLSGITWVAELSLVATLGVTAAAYGTITLERDLWLRYLMCLWVPVVAATSYLALQGDGRALVVFALQSAVIPFAYYQGLRMVHEFVDNLLVQARLETSNGQAERHRDELRRHRTWMEELLRRTHQLAYFDQLTGIGSRTNFTERLTQMIEEASLTHSQFALFHLDLDGFKDINDSLGHEVGDKLLTITAKRLSSLLRNQDFSARLGSDEFAFLITEINNDADALRIAERCLEETNKPVQLKGTIVRPSVSIGIARFPRNGIKAQSLLKASESAMHAAKQSGKHRYSLYAPSMTRAAEKRLQTEHDLVHALENGQFVLQYQPQIDFETGRLCGVESLIRWFHPQRGMIPPNEFIGLAERMGLIDRIGYWVMATACAQAMRWFEDVEKPFTVSVNISPLQLEDPTFPTTVSRILRTTGLAPELLELEITESAIQTNAHYLPTLIGLRESGVKISIDDFGTGFSSLASIKTLPCDRVKIDRVFVIDMLRDPRYAILLEKIVEMVRALGYGVVAEGVESAEQANALHALGCDILQGYYYSHPVAPEKIREMVTKGFADSLSLPEPLPARVRGRSGSA